jgi:hypothetical protein
VLNFGCSSEACLREKQRFCLFNFFANKTTKRSISHREVKEE